MQAPLSTRRGGSALVLVASWGALAGLGAPAVDRSERVLSEARRIVAGFDATSAREGRLTESFATEKTFTVARDGQTKAQVVAALRFTAPDVKDRRTSGAGPTA